jgi:aquaporin Z
MVAEFLGTFALCFFGIMSIVTGSGGLVGVALAHGLILAIAITGAMNISGGQFNPAVSLGLIVAGVQNWQRALTFIGVQLFAAACATGMVVFIMGVDQRQVVSSHLGATMGAFNDPDLLRSPGAITGNTMKVFALEAIATFALMYAVLMATVDSRVHKLGGLMIGLTVTVCILAIGPWTGASMNPARTFGPALYTVANQQLWWVYCVAPVVGASLCAIVSKLFWGARA